MVYTVPVVRKGTYFSVILIISHHSFPLLLLISLLKTFKGFKNKTW